MLKYNKRTNNNTCMKRSHNQCIVIIYNKHIKHPYTATASNGDHFLLILSLFAGDMYIADFFSILI